jgi:alkyldihydroxyacetonephosphate synthase
MRIRRPPEEEHFYAAFFPNFSLGLTAMREISQAELNLSMLRLSDPLETETTFQLSGEEKLVNIAKKGLNLFGQGDKRCMLIYGLTGNRASNHLADRQLAHFVRKYQGLIVKFYLGEAWMEKRFLTPYLRNTLWDLGYALDTLETALPWDKIATARDHILTALRNGLTQENEIVLAFSHVSHVYTNGGSLYITYLFRRAQDPHATLSRWQKLKNAASQQIVAMGGTITHQHGVGMDHKPYLAAEKGALGMRMLANIIKDVDPNQVMNAGKLIEIKE